MHLNSIDYFQKGPNYVNQVAKIELNKIAETPSRNIFQNLSRINSSQSNKMLISQSSRPSQAKNIPSRADHLPSSDQNNSTSAHLIQSRFSHPSSGQNKPTLRSSHQVTSESALQNSDSFQKFQFQPHLQKQQLSKLCL